MKSVVTVADILLVLAAAGQREGTWDTGQEDRWKQEQGRLQKLRCPHQFYLRF